MHIIIWICIGIIFLIGFTFMVRNSVVCAYHKRNRLLNSPYFKNAHSILRSMLKAVTEGFSRFQIVNWWLDSGSLLGQVRHNGFIPHDDDIDIAILIKDENDEKKLEECYDYLKNTYSDQFKVDIIYKHTYNSVAVQIIDITTKNGFTIDLFYVREKNDIFWTNSIALLFWPNGYYYRESTYPLKTVQFEGSTVYIPADPVRYLYQMYGKDCLKVLKMDDVHSTNSLFDRLNVWWIKDIPLYIPDKQSV